MAHYKRKGKSRKYGKCGMCTSSRGNGKKLAGYGRGSRLKDFLLAQAEREHPVE